MGSAVGSGHGLCARVAQLDDGEAPVREPDSRFAIAPDRTGVGAAVPERIAHRPGEVVICGGGAALLEIDKAGYAAHAKVLSVALATGSAPCMDAISAHGLICQYEAVAHVA